MYYPQPLKHGSRVAICAFSSSVQLAYQQRLDKVIEHLNELGFEVIEGEALRDHREFDAAARADELMRFLLDDGISAVVPPWGGELAMKVLPLLDWSALAQAKPKWMFGFSDVSTVMTALTTRLDWATLHSSNLMQLSQNVSEPLTNSVFKALSLKAGEHFLQTSSSYCEVENSLSIADPRMTFNLTHETRWRLLKNKYESSSEEITFSGRLLGGCLDTHQHLLQTEFADIDQFAIRHDMSELILYLENAELTDNSYIRALLGLQFRGVFKRVSGLLIGRNLVNISNENDEAKVLLSALAHLTIPVVYDVDIGHCPPNMTLVNGAFAKVKITASQGTVTQYLK